MTGCPAAALPAADVRPVRQAGRHPALVIAGQVARKSARSGALWGLIFGCYVAAQTLAYTSAYRTQASRDELTRSFGTNVGLNALIGPARAINTVAGFASWRALGILSLLGAIWGLLTSTRLMRGRRGGRAVRAAAGRADNAPARHRPGAGWTRRGTSHAVRADFGGRGADGPGPVSGLYPQPVPVLRGHPGRRRGRIPGRRSAYQPAGQHPPPGRSHGWGGVRHGLRHPHGRRFRSQAALDGLAEPARLDRGIQAPDASPPAGAAARCSSWPPPHPRPRLYLAGRRDLDAGTLPGRDTAKPHLSLVGSAGGLAVRLMRPVGAGLAVRGGRVLRPAGHGGRIIHHRTSPATPAWSTT